MKKISLSVGIPAHNEEKNIQNVLNSVLSQRQTSFILEQVYVVCDGCTDKTAEIVKNHYTRNKKVILLNDGKRKGKSGRLNQIYTRNTSDLLLTIDADVVFKSSRELEKLVLTMLSNPQLVLVGPRYQPVKSGTLMGKFAEYSYLIFEQAIFSLNEGNNIYALMGCASLIRKSLTKKMRYPKGVISDQNYLFLKATLTDKDAFALCKESIVLFRTVTSFHDWRLLSVRSIRGDKSSVKQFFGEKIFNDVYRMPFYLYYRALIKTLVRHPVYSAGAFLMNAYIRLFPYKAEPVKNGIWESTETSKEAIYV